MPQTPQIKPAQSAKEPTARQTVEEWAARKGDDRPPRKHLLEGACVHHKWPQGQLLTEQEYDQGMADFAMQKWGSP